jgi:hypothetical protein
MCLAAVFLTVAPAAATEINTGNPEGPYHASFCPQLASQLARAKLDYTCVPSSGTLENIDRVAADPRQIGYGRLDVLAREAPASGSPRSFARLRIDDVRECLFAATRATELRSYGEITANASKLRFVLPPETSDSAAAFRALQGIAPAHLGEAKTVMHTQSTEQALQLALSADDTVAVFTQFPDPDHASFKLIERLGGHVVPVLDRDVLRQQANGEKLFFAQEIQISGASWVSPRSKIVTVCTPMVVFTGAPDAIGDPKARQDHQDLIATVRALKADALMPEETVFARALKRTKELSADSAERLIKLSEEARRNALPYLERAREATERAYEAARPSLERARDYTFEAYEKAREEMKDFMAPKDPAETPKQ